MLKNWFFPASVAFIVSFLLGLVFLQSTGLAFAVAFLSLPAAAIGGYMQHQRRGRQVRSTLAHAQEQIRVLQRRGAQMHQALAMIADEKQQVIAYLDALQVQAQQLELQIADRLEQKKELDWKLTHLELKKRQLEQQSHVSQAQVRLPLETAAGSTPTVSQLKAELQAETTRLQTQLSEQQAQYQRLTQELSGGQTQLLEQQAQHQRLNQELSALAVQKQELETTVQALRLEVRQLERQRLEQQSVRSAATSQTAVRQLQSQVNSLRQELEQLEAHILDRRQQKEALEQEITIAKQERSAPVKKVTDTPASLPSEWTEFLVQLPLHEFQVLKLIQEQENPGPAIRRIAEEQVTMPELLIDSINERAIETIGDIVIESGSGRETPTIVPEHGKIVGQMIETYEYLTR